MEEQPGHWCVVEAPCCNPRALGWLLRTGLGAQLLLDGSIRKISLNIQKLEREREREGESNGLPFLCKSGFGLFLSNLPEVFLRIVCLSGMLCLHRPDLHLFCVNSG